MADLFLLPDSAGRNLESLYKRSFNNAVELFIVSAYLTEWNPPSKLNGGCRAFRIIVGKDFGITRKDACRKVIRWIPKSKKHNFLVASGLDGFHPKAVFWKESDDSHHALVGSSNLTKAAFTSNHEANIYETLTAKEFERARKWIHLIEKSCEPADGEWLRRYIESNNRGKGPSSRKSSSDQLRDILKLPRTRGMSGLLEERRKQLRAYQKHQAGLMKLFKDCAAGRITSAEFYERLSSYWGYKAGDRFQGEGWQIAGKRSDFQALSKAFLAIVDAKDDERDDEVADQLDKLSKLKVPARGSFLTEMLCLRFPSEYPVKNKPSKEFLKAIEFKGPRGASEGVSYVDLACRLRLALRLNKDYPARDLAELDTIIWKVYGKSSN